MRGTCAAATIGAMAHRTALAILSGIPVGILLGILFVLFAAQHAD